MKLKQLDTLFHGTKKYTDLSSIVKNGFYPSYATEPFAHRLTKILMVSFSNIPLMEARNQVSYGDYFIGLNRQWGIRNGLHPVAYSYMDSKYENDVSYLQHESAIGQTLSLLRSFNEKGLSLDFAGDALQLVGELSKQDISADTAAVLHKMFEGIYIKTNSMQLYLKHYIVKDKKGRERYAYNDREWRYIPESSPKLIFEKDASGKVSNPDFMHYDTLQKPHLKTDPLTFEIQDINYIIVKHKSEVRKIINVLEKKFTKDALWESILSGNLSVLAMDKIWGDL